MHGPALGNGDRLLQVLNNLLSNAVKFTPRGGHIEVRARREAVLASDPAAPPVPHGAPGAWAPTETGEHRVHDFARVDVSDSGPGMSEETRARLFEKFGQHGQRRSGIGLGLYISREIVRSHGGSLWVESEAGEGSVFSFRIPVA
jgi:two-component system phosphate regulon sensor histidine kinase PhoR